MKHTAITIGPIHKTLQQARSTKAIWAASYLFSYLIKKLLIKSNVTNNDVILPYFEPSDLTTSFHVGLFPDRILFNKEMPVIENHIIEVIKEFSIEIEADLKKEKQSIKQQDVVDFFQDYLHFSALHIEVPDGENKIFYLNKYLDSRELQNKVVVNAKNNFLYEFLEDKYYNFLVTNEFDAKEKRFPSTIEIAMAEFKEKNNTVYQNAVNLSFKNQRKPDGVEFQESFINQIYNNEVFNKTKLNYQKYIAVVQADGDNMGSFIREMYNQENGNELITEFSKSLFNFSRQAVTLIEKYKGTPIYAGGDDLLFICPIAHAGLIETDRPNKNKIVIKNSIITLIEDIDKIFEELILNNDLFKEILEKVNKKPSMSYGLSISYYKYPLNQALEQGVNQLFYKAKKTCEKNAVSYAILKHSGQFIGTLFHKSKPSYKTFSELITTKVHDENYVKSITHKINPLESVIYGIGSISDDTKRLEKWHNFFWNNFDESVHRKKVNGQKVLIDFLDITKKLLDEVYLENPIHNITDTNKCMEQHQSNINQVYAALRFVEFLNNKEER